MPKISDSEVVATSQHGSGEGNATKPGLIVEALFLGPKSENREFFENQLRSITEDHIHWRSDFHPADKALVSPEDMRDSSFVYTLDRTSEVLDEVSARLRQSQGPWFSVRYLGHMLSDILMVANLAKIATVLYNPNNCAYEASEATEPMELEVGRDFGRLLGYDEKTSWGHITTDGTVANYESLWLARNLKSFPSAVKQVSPDLVKNLDDWQLLNLTVDKILDLVDETKKNGTFAKALDASARGRGAGGGRLGKVLVPQTRHYSWEKAADVLGIGLDSLVNIRVTNRYRMDIGTLRTTLQDCLDKKIPVLALIAVVGTTEEGAVDDVAAIVALREEFEEKGLSFYFHIDAAYGGYGRALFLDEKGSFMEYEDLESRLQDLDVGGAKVTFPSQEVWNSYRAMPAANSVTIDPHKMGYIPYAAGGISVRDKRILGLVSYSAAYVFDGKDIELNLASVILEGSKSGASAAGVWAAHRLLPQNISGYGQLMARSMGGARYFVRTLDTVREFEVAGTTIVCHPLLSEPDFNIVCMAFNFKGNTDLTKMNAFNTKIYHASSYSGGRMYGEDWITSHTVLESSSYGDAPLDFIKKFGIAESEWNSVGQVVVLRACVLHPWMASTPNYPEHWQSYLDIMKTTIGRILADQNLLTRRKKQYDPVAGNLSTQSARAAK
jgi:tyrosine decarboxylase